MQRFKFRLNKKKAGDRLIMVWLESLPERRRSLRVREVLREYIENNSKGLRVNGREKRVGSKHTGNRTDEVKEPDKLLDQMF